MLCMIIVSGNFIICTHLKSCPERYSLLKLKHVKVKVDFCTTCNKTLTLDYILTMPFKQRYKNQTSV